LDIRTEVSANPSGWRAKQVMEIIYNRIGIRYHEVYAYRLLHNGVLVLKFQERGLLVQLQRKRKIYFEKG
jgi:uncharacterized membrane protein YobD (UPF0266 family)